MAGSGVSLQIIGDTGAMLYSGTAFSDDLAKTIASLCGGLSTRDAYASELQTYAQFTPERDSGYYGWKPSSVHYDIAKDILVRNMDTVNDAIGRIQTDYPGYTPDTAGLVLIERDEPYSGSSSGGGR